MCTETAHASASGTCRYHCQTGRNLKKDEPRISQLPAVWYSICDCVNAKDGQVAQQNEGNQTFNQTEQSDLLPRCLRIADGEGPLFAANHDLMHPQAQCSTYNAHMCHCAAATVHQVARQCHDANRTLASTPLVNLTTGIFCAPRNPRTTPRAPFTSCELAFMVWMSITCAPTFSSSRVLACGSKRNGVRASFGGTRASALGQLAS